MRSAKVFYKNEEAGILTQIEDGSFSFEYHVSWIKDVSKASISLVLPKEQKFFKSPYLFPFFYNMLPEGTNKQIVCFNLRIDENDSFGILLATTENDTIGAVRVLKNEVK